MRIRVAMVAALLLLAMVLGSVTAASGGERQRLSASLSGYEETPALSVEGTGTFSAKLSADGASLDYRLEYSGLTGDAAAAHIHLGQEGVAGGVIAFLCGGGGQADCPGAAGTVTGTITADNVVGPAAQGIEAGEFDELVAALEVGATYANVHTAAFPAGEIRGQIG